MDPVFAVAEMFQNLRCIAGNIRFQRFGFFAELFCRLEKLRRRGDTSDMFACGYVIQQENGRYGIWADGFPLCNYLELEYYEKPLTGFSQLLRPVGEYLKGACGIQSLLNQCILLLRQDQNHDA